MGKNNLTSMRYLLKVPFLDLANWSVGYLLGTEFGYNNRFPLVSISTFLTRNKTGVDIKNKILYTRVTIKTMGMGITVRDKLYGEKIGTKKQFVIHSGQFLVSKIDARNGAFGVVPDEADGAIITGNFWTFDVDTSKINPAYLALLTSSKQFVSFAEKASNGTTNRRYLQENPFLAAKIPLPSLDEQAIIVDTYNKAIKEANEIEIEVDKTESELKEWLINYLGISMYGKTTNNNKLNFVNYKNLLKWSIGEIQRSDKYSFDHAKYEVIKIGDIINSFEGGKTPSTKCKEYWGEDVYWVSAKDMKELYLLNIQDKLSQKGVEETKMKIYPKGTILGVFRSGILRHSFPICITAHSVTINQDLKALGLHEKKAKKMYFLFYIHLLQDIVLNVAMKKGVTVESINVDAFMEIPFICPPMRKQCEIVRYIYEKEKYIYKKREEAKRLRLRAISVFETKIFK